MERIPHRELRNRSSEILRAVAAGESYEITNHGKVVAVLSPPGRPVLQVIQPTIHGRWHELEPQVGNGESTEQILDDLREERL